jgi:hypothetical protein
MPTDDVGANFWIGSKAAVATTYVSGQLSATEQTYRDPEGYGSPVPEPDPRQISNPSLNAGRARVDPPATRTWRRPAARLRRPTGSFGALPSWSSTIKIRSIVAPAAGRAVPSSMAWNNSDGTLRCVCNLSRDASQQEGAERSAPSASQHEHLGRTLASTREDLACRISNARSVNRLEMPMILDDRFRLRENIVREQTPCLGLAASKVLRSCVLSELLANRTETVNSGCHGQYDELGSCAGRCFRGILQCGNRAFRSVYSNQYDGHGELPNQTRFRAARHISDDSVTSLDLEVEDNAFAWSANSRFQ